MFLEKFRSGKLITSTQFLRHITAKQNRVTLFQVLMPHAGAFNFAFAHFTTKFTHFKLNKISVVSTSSVLEDFSDFCLSPLSINRDYNKNNLIFLRIITRRKRLICHGELCSATIFLAEKLRATITEFCPMALVHFAHQITLNIPKFIVLCFYGSNSLYPT